MVSDGNILMSTSWRHTNISITHGLVLFVPFRLVSSHNMFNFAMDILYGHREMWQMEHNQRRHLPTLLSLFSSLHSDSHGLMASSQ